MNSLARGDVTVTLVSEDSAGSQGNNESRNASMNANGQFVAFSSVATNLVPNGTNGYQVFVKNLTTGDIVLASADATGAQGNSGSGGGAGTGLSISSDGRFVAFVTSATNLVPIDTDKVQVLVKNLQTGEIVRVTENVAGEPGNNDSYSPSISADGTYVAFESIATNLVPVDTGDPPARFERAGVFVKNIVTGEIIQVSKDAVINDDTGNLGVNVSISADGRFVAFPSRATNLVPDDTNESLDVFVKNIMTGEIVRVSEDATGIQGNRYSGDTGISISDDGLSVAFSSAATNLVPNDTNNALDLFVKNLETGTIVRVNENADGELGNEDSIVPSLSSDGRFVAFASSASNLISGDTNGSTDIFVKNVETGAIVRVATGMLRSSISNDGRLVAFSSSATNLVLDDTNNSADVFLADIDIGRAPTAPVNLRFVVYSRTAAELFWDRPVGQAYLYRVYFNGALVGETDGISWFSEDFTPGSVTTVEVVAVDSNGVESAPSEVIIQTDAGGLSSVTGLRADVYSSTAAEIFWDRMPGPIHYRVYADGVEVAITDGTSWFSEEFGAGSTTEMTVVAIDGSNESAPRHVIVTTRGGNSEEPPSGVPAITGLRAEVYSENFAEVFWDRPTGQAYSYRVFFNELLEVETDGISWWSRDFAPGSITEVTIIAVDSRGAVSPPATVVVQTPGGDIDPESISYEIGDIGPAGGIVFSVSDDGTNGLEAAPPDQDTMALWCSDFTDIEGVDNVDWFGPADSHSGAHNTPLIVAACGDNSAAGIAANYVWPIGQTDGFLPSKDELALLIGQQAVVGGFAQDDYWSSTESENPATAVIITAPYLGLDSTWKDNTTVWVRAVRAF